MSSPATDEKHVVMTAHTNIFNDKGSFLFNLKEDGYYQAKDSQTDIFFTHRAEIYISLISRHHVVGRS